MHKLTEEILTLIDALVQEPKLTDQQVAEELDNIIGHAAEHRKMYGDVE